MQKRKLLTIALILQLLVTLGLGSAVACGSTRDRAPSGLIVWGRDFSGLSKNEVSSQLKKMIPNAVSLNGTVYPLKLDRSYADIDNWLDILFQFKTGNHFSDLIHTLERPFVVISPNPLEVNKEEIIAQLQALSVNINKTMLPATITYTNGRLVKTKGQDGQELDIDATLLKISQEHKLKQVELIVNSIPALPDAEDVLKISNILGDYTTYFDPQDVPRTKNLRLASIAINNHLIPPGEVFSFNDVVGERTEAAGYLPAFVFEGNEIVKGDGGGICQDSSTLFQAVRQAHLSIVEQHTHSLPVSYVLKGQDATVSFGVLDFRFRNDTKGYLLLSSRTGQNWLRIKLFGLADEKHPELLKPEGYPRHPEDWTQDPK